jgi:hypothetical protein
VVRRWFDAVVLDHTDEAVTGWEPNHGTVLAQLDEVDAFVTAHGLWDRLT